MLMQIAQLKILPYSGQKVLSHYLFEFIFISLRKFFQRYESCYNR
jgi:hypothetical protein